MMKWKVVKGPRSASVDGRSLECLKETFPMSISDSNNNNTHSHNSKQLLSCKQQDVGFVRKPSLVASDCLSWKGFLGLTRQRSETNLSALSLPPPPPDHPRQRSRSEVRGDRIAIAYPPAPKAGWLRGRRRDREDKTTVVIGTRRSLSRTTRTDQTGDAEVESTKAPPRRSRKGQAPRPGGDVSLNPSGEVEGSSSLVERSPCIAKSHLSRGKSTVVAEVHSVRKDDGKRDAVERKSADRRNSERKDADRKESERRSADKKDNERDAERGDTDKKKRDSDRKDVKKRDCDRKDNEKRDFDRRNLERRNTGRKDVDRRDMESRDTERKDSYRNDAERNDMDRAIADERNTDVKDSERSEFDRKADRRDSDKSNLEKKDTDTKHTGVKEIGEEFVNREIKWRNVENDLDKIEESSSETGNKSPSDESMPEENDLEERERVQEIQIEIPPFRIDTPDYSTLGSESGWNNRTPDITEQDHNNTNLKIYAERNNLNHNSVLAQNNTTGKNINPITFAEESDLEYETCSEKNTMNSIAQNTLKNHNTESCTELNNNNNPTDERNNLKNTNTFLETEKNNHDNDVVSSILRCSSGHLHPLLHKKVVRFERVDLLENFKRQKASDDDSDTPLDVNSNEIHPPECPQMRVDVVVPAECHLSVDSQVVVKKSFVLTVAKQERGFRSLCANKKPEVAKKDHKISVTFLCSAEHVAPPTRIRSVSVPPPQVVQEVREVAPPPPLVRGRSRDRKSKERHSKRSKSAKKKDTSHNLPQAVIDELAQVLEKRKPSLDRPTAKVN